MDRPLPDMRPSAEFLAQRTGRRKKTGSGRQRTQAIAIPIKNGQMIAWCDTQKSFHDSDSPPSCSERESSTLIDGQRTGFFADRFTRENKRRFEIEEGLLDQPPTHQGEHGSYHCRS